MGGGVVGPECAVPPRYGRAQSRELSHLMGETLSDELKDIYHRAQKKGMPVFVTPY
jgi:hypothetical protein